MLSECGCFVCSVYVRGCGCMYVFLTRSSFPVQKLGLVIDGFTLGIVLDKDLEKEFSTCLYICLSVSVSVSVCSFRLIMSRCVELTFLLRVFLCVCWLVAAGKPTLASMFVELAQKCLGVICCRMSPKQKVRRHTNTCLQSIRVVLFLSYIDLFVVLSV